MNPGILPTPGLDFVRIDEVIVSQILHLVVTCSAIQVLLKRFPREHILDEIDRIHPTLSPVTLEAVIVVEVFERVPTFLTLLLGFFDQGPNLLRRFSSVAVKIINGGTALKVVTFQIHIHRDPVLTLLIMGIGVEDDTDLGLSFLKMVFATESAEMTHRAIREVDGHRSVRVETGIKLSLSV